MIQSRYQKAKGFRLMLWIILLVAFILAMARWDWLGSVLFSWVKQP